MTAASARWTLAGMSAVIQAHQLAQLHALNQQLYQQQAHARYQAHLEQALFETEARARRILATAPLDPFAAAILAHDWQQRIQGIGPELFQAADAKRAWARAHGAIQRVMDDTRRTPQLLQEVEEYLRLVAEWQATEAEAPNLGPEKLERARKQLSSATTWAPRLGCSALAMVAGLGGGMAVILVGAALRSTSPELSAVVSLAGVAGGAVVRHRLPYRSSTMAGYQ